MRDLYKSIDYIERGLLRGLDRKVTSLPKGMVPKSSVRAWRAPVANDDVYPEQVFAPKAKLRDEPRNNSRSRDKPKDRPMTRLTARALKVTVPLDPAEVRALHIPDNQTRAQLAITCEGKVYTANIATKALRKAKGTIAANRVENVFAMVQGKLKGNEIVECGLVAQVKTPKPTVGVGTAATP